MNAVRRSPEDIALVENCRRDPAKLIVLPDHVYKSSEDPNNLEHLRKQSQLELTQLQRWMIGDFTMEFRADSGFYNGYCPLCEKADIAFNVEDGLISFLTNECGCPEDDIKHWLNEHVDIDQMIDFKEHRIEHASVFVLTDEEREDRNELLTDLAAEDIYRGLKGDDSRKVGIEKWQETHGKHAYYRTIINKLVRAQNGLATTRELEEIDALIEKAINPPSPLEPIRNFNDYDTTQWMVEKWLPRGHVSLLSGMGGVGKSRLTLQIATAIATQGGTDILGDGSMVTARQANVIYCSWEDSENEIKRRINQLEYKGTEESLSVFDLRRYGPIWAPVIGSRHIATIAEPTKLYHDIEKHARKFEAKFIVFDTIAAAYLSDENNRPLVRSFLTTLSAFANDLDASILLISHPSKSRTEDFTTSGSTDWINGVRCAFTLDRTKSEQPFLRQTKNNLSSLADPIYLDKITYPYIATDKEAVIEEVRECEGYKWKEGEHACSETVTGKNQRCPDCKKQQAAIQRRGKPTTGG